MQGRADKNLSQNLLTIRIKPRIHSNLRCHAYSCEVPCDGVSTDIGTANSCGP